MKNDFLKNSSQRVLFSALMASALAIGNLAPMHAEVASVQSVMQSVSVKGQVLDGDGIPVIGASILEKGTTNGVITDIDGNYSLNVSSKNAVIVISYYCCPIKILRSYKIRADFICEVSPFSLDFSRQTIKSNHGQKYTF